MLVIRAANNSNPIDIARYNLSPGFFTHIPMFLHYHSTEVTAILSAIKNNVKGYIPLF